MVSSLSLGSAAWMHFRLRSVKISKSKPRQRELSILLRHVSRTWNLHEYDPDVLDRVMS